MMGGISRQDSNAILIRYLQSWGLREFHDEPSYYEWQRTELSPQNLLELQTLVELRQGGANEQADIQFYDLLAKPPLLSVLYSQRFDYFLQIGLLISPRLSLAKHVLDFGCGVGILTCFFAQQHPDVQFVGMDRSARSIEIAQEEARKRHLSNVQFRVIQNLEFPLGEMFDCILSTQVLFQSEREPGLPSLNWKTFERTKDSFQQEEIEARVGLDRRLDFLLRMLSFDGRLICFEKTWNLGRQILFQRALSRRSLSLVSDPISCTYHELGEARIDGPLYEVSRSSGPVFHLWSEAACHRNGETLYRCMGDVAERMGRALGCSQPQEIARGEHRTLGPWVFQIGLWEQALAWGVCETDSGFRGLILGSPKDKDFILQIFEKARDLVNSEFEDFLQSFWGTMRDDPQSDSTPGYENHFPSAQNIYWALPQKVIQQESTYANGQGKEMHMEVGTTDTFQYFYWANTFDQRQLVLIDENRADILHEYYQESLQDAQASA